MIDHRVQTEEVAAFPRAMPLSQAEEPAGVLEQRVRRLEDAVASLQDTRQMEERVAERVTERVNRKATHIPRESAPLVVDSGRKLLPAALDLMRSQDSGPRAPAAPRALPDLRNPWLPFDLYVELRAIWRMFVDPRYRLSWMGRVIPLALFLGILSSWYWLPFAGLLYDLSHTLASLYVKLVDLLLAYFLTKVLVREARRYRETFPELESRSAR
jgi:hypothetical protein